MLAARGNGLIAVNIRAACRQAFGQFSWVPPAWARTIGARRAGYGVLTLAAAAVLAVAGYSYYRSLPQPLQVGVAVTPPGVTAIVDGELAPDVLRLDFRYLPHEHGAGEQPLSAARLDRVGETLESGVRLIPALPGSWRFATENRLVFTPAEDWPAGRAYRVRLAPELFAPGIRLAADEARFETPPFQAALTSAVFHQNPELADERTVVASFRFTHPVARTDFESRVALSIGEDGAQDGAARPFGHRVEYGPHDRSAHLHSLAVAIGEREAFATVALAAGLAPANGDGETPAALTAQVRIPSRTSYFQLGRLETSIVEDGEARLQTAVFTFTDAVRTAAFADAVQAWVLPEDHRLGGTLYGRYHWRSPREVTRAVLAAADPLPLSVNPTERDWTTLQSATFDAPAGRYVYFRVEAGLESAGGFALAAAHDDVARAPAYPQEAAIAQEGALLPLTGERRLTFTARGVEALRVEIQQVQASAINHLASQSAGDIRDPWFPHLFNADNVSSLTTRIIPLNPGHPRQQTFASLDLVPFLAGGGLFFVQVQGWDAEHEHALTAPDRRMALVTDLGLLVKANVDQSQHVFVHSVTTGEPVSGARVELLGRNGVAVRQGVTDVRGHALLASADDLERERQPTVFVVRHGDDLTFMPYRRRDRRLSWQGFDIGGERVRPGEEDRLKAALYTDRGLYRPGETVRLFGIVRQSDFDPVPGAPVELRIADARGASVMRQRAALPRDGLLTWRLATRVESPTGTYRASIYLVEDDQLPRMLGDASFRVEDYRPDQLRIRVAIEEDRGGEGEAAPAVPAPARSGWMQPGVHAARVTLANLFGTPAQGRRVRGRLVLEPVSPGFAEHPGFAFTDPYRAADAVRRTLALELPETTTGADGVARLPLDVSGYDNGIFRLRLTVEGFEADGGQGVKATASTLLSLASVLIGHKADGELAFIARNGERSVRFLALAKDAAPVAVDDLQAVLYERRYVSVLTKQPNGAFAYQSALKEDEVERQPFAVAEDGAEYRLPTEQPGRYALVLVDAEGVALSRVEFTVAGARNLAGNLERNAELELTLDRPEYASGDEIALAITAPYAGAGLITIERDRVHAFKWFQSATNTTVQRIRLPAGIEGNAYVQVAFVRDMDSAEIFVSPLSYAVAPFAVRADARRLAIHLDAPDTVRPGEELVVGYRSETPARIVLYAVDEGIAQVAEYQTPAPLAVFLAKRALQVATHQMVDLILPDYNVIRRAAAPGGGAAQRLLGANLNPFRRRTEAPVAFWTGVLDAAPERREARLGLPDHFNGELRVMAVGVAAAKMGARQLPVTVRGPLVLTPNAPLAVAPGDAFDVSVGVANNVADSGPDAVVALAAEPSPRLSVAAATALALPIAAGGEGRGTFRVRAGEALGDGQLTLTARLDDALVSREVGLSVRPAVPFVTTVASGFDAAGSPRLDLPRRMHEAFARRRVSVSASPLVLADGMLEYLETFPHACAEQLVSKVFPQLGLLQATTFPVDRAALGALFRTTLEHLRRRQTAAGGFRFWTTSAEAAAFPSVYIAHFMTDARALGLAVPGDMHDAAQRYLGNLAGGTGGDLTEARTRAYAIYVRTRNGMVTTNHLNDLQAMLMRRYDAAWRTDIAAAYMAASHALLRNDVLATVLIDGYRLGEATPDTDFDTRLGRDAQYVYLLARHFPQRLAQLDGEALRALVEPIFENRFNTLSAAYAILALGEMHRALARGGLPAPKIEAWTAAGAVDVVTTGSVFVQAELPVDARRLAVTGETGLYYVVSESGFDVDVPDTALADGLEVDLAYLDAAGGRVVRAAVGDEVTVRLRVRSRRGAIGNVAVTHLLPGGFETIAASVRDSYGPARLDYKDVREDRVVLYGGFDERMTEIRYRVKAMSPGDFAAPAAHAAAMYHRGVGGRSAAGRFTIDGA